MVWSTSGPSAAGWAAEIPEMTLRFSPTFSFSGGPSIKRLLVCAALGAALAVPVLGQGPTPNGLYYGDGDSSRYPAVPYAVSVSGSRLYATLVDTTLHVVLVVDRSVNDNVFDVGPGSATAYMTSADWGSHRTARRLCDSEFAEFFLTVGSGAEEQTFQWRQGYAGASSGSRDKTVANWISDTTVAGGGGNPPPGLVSASSMQWNMNNYAAKLAASSNTWTMPGANANDNQWKSPFDAGNPNTVINAAEGYPAVGDISWSPAYEWEWAMVYEWAVDLSQFADVPVFIVTGASHHSPAKNGPENDIFPDQDPNDPPPPLMDYGDLPVPYPTLLADDGARHVLDPNGTRLGSSLDSDGDGQPHALALGDDQSVVDDEDGVELLSPMFPGSNAVFRVTVAKAGYLSAFTDWDGDGTLDSVTLGSATGPAVVAAGVFEDVFIPTNGVYDIEVPVPPDAGGLMATRFRITNLAGQGGASPSGQAHSGEVEDYVFSAALGDRVWSDANGNGIQNGGEPGLGGIEVLLLATNGSEVASTTTDEQGYYLFGGVPPGHYLVEWDLSDFLLGGQLLSAPDQGNDALDSDGVEQLFGGFVRTAPFHLVAGETNLTVDVGVSPVILSSRASVAEVWGEWSGGEARVCWKTSSEWGTAGFRVYRVGAGGEMLVSDGTVASAFKPEGARYAWIDPMGSPGGRATYRIEEVELDGTLLDMGVFDVEFKPVAHVPAPPAAVRSAAMDNAGLGAPAMASGLAAGDAPPSDCVKLVYRKPGVYAVAYEALASAMGLDAQWVAGMSAAGNLALYAEGRHVAYVPDPENQRILFYGAGTTNFYTRDAAVIIRQEPGLLMGMRPAVAAEDAQNVYRAEVRYEEDRLFLDSSGLPLGDFFYWDYVLSGNPSLGSRTFPLDLTGFAGGDALLRVRLIGLSAVEHAVEFLLDGILVGEASFSGIETHEAEVILPAGVLSSDVVQFAVRGSRPSSASSFFAVDWIEVAFDRRLVSSALPHVLSSGEGGAWSLAELNGPVVFELGGAGPLRVDEGEAFVASSDRDYVVADAQSIASLDPWPAACDAWFMNTGLRIDYLVVASRDMADAAQSLADYRAAQGLRTGVAVFEDVCDLLGYGQRDPEAIRALLRHAHENWAEAPWMLLLAGNGHYDYHGTLGLEPNPLPPILHLSPRGVFSADSKLGDLDGDGVPEVAVGRLPAKNASELSVMVSSIVLYEADFESDWQKALVFAADVREPGLPSPADFARDSEVIAGRVPASHPIHRVYRDDLPAATGRDQLIGHFNSGAGIIHFTGHGNPTTMGQSKTGVLMSTSNLGQIQNTRRPVLVALSCLIGRFESPGQNSLGEQLMASPGGGTVAVWAPSGLSHHPSAALLGDAFYAQLFEQGSGSLGLAVLRARQAVASIAAGQETFATYNLLGDPALKLGAAVVGNPGSGGFAQWRWERFSPGQLADSSVSGEAGSPIGEGPSNLLSYAQGLPPGQSAALVRRIWAPRGLEGWEVDFGLRSDAGDLDYVFRVTEDLLGEWEENPADGQVAPGTADLEPLGFTYRVNRPEARTLFLDVVIRRR